MRARNIKPGFFESENVAELSFQARLLFIGLWCLADREGRLEDRPKRIHAQVFPYDPTLDINGELTVIERLGFIRRYQLPGQRLIQIVNFKKHQNPHHTEKSSNLPEMVDDEGNSDLTVNSRLSNGEYPADSLIPDSLIPDSKDKDIVGQTKIDQPPAPNGIEPPKQAEAEPGGPEPEHLMALWNEQKHPNLPGVEILTQKRKVHVRSRLKDFPDKEFWVALMQRINQSPLLTGQNDRGWTATFDWVMNPTNLVKILEGNYDRKRGR